MKTGILSGSVRPDLEEWLIRLEAVLDKEPFNPERLREFLILLELSSDELDSFHEQTSLSGFSLESFKNLLSRLDSCQSREDLIYYLFELKNTLPEFQKFVQNPAFLKFKQENRFRKKCMVKARQILLGKLTHLVEDIEEKLFTLRKKSSSEISKNTIQTEVQETSSPSVSNQRKSSTSASATSLDRKIIRVQEVLKDLASFNPEQLKEIYPWLIRLEKETQEARVRCLDSEQDSFETWKSELKRSELLEALLDFYDQKIEATKNRTDLDAQAKEERISLWKRLQKEDQTRLKLRGK